MEEAVRARGPAYPTGDSRQENGLTPKMVQVLEAMRESNIVDHLVASGAPREQAADTSDYGDWLRFLYRSRHTGIPPRYSVSIMSFPESVQRAVMPFLEGRANTLYIWGTVGTGKTCLAAAVLAVWRQIGCGLRPGGNVPMREHGWRGAEAGLFVSAYDLAAHLRDIDRVEVSRRVYAEAAILVLDDLGSNRATPHLAEQILFILQERYDYRRPTIVTSNLSLAGLSDAVDERAASRFSEGVVIELAGRDRRVSKGSEKP